MAIKERKQITGTEAQIKGYAGHNGVLAYATDTKHLHVLSGTAGTTTKLANMSDIPAPVDISGKADKTYVDTQLGTKATKTELTTGLAGKANSSHTHTVSQITDMPNVVLSVNNITPASGGNVNLGLHAVATSGDYNDLRNKPSLPSTPSAYITETWKSTDGASWYRKWSDGWIEQGGNYDTDSIYRASITLTVPMKTTNYYCDATSEFTSDYKDNSFIYIMRKTTTGFHIGALTLHGTWEVRGY